LGRGSDAGKGKAESYYLGGKLEEGKGSASAYVTFLLKKPDW